MKFISYSQNFEDVMLWRAFKNIEKGFYIDVGANDPVQDSVTKAFYDRGWRGINIEPVDSWYEKIKSERCEDINLQIAAGDFEGELCLFEVVGTGLSTTNKDYVRRHSEERGYEVRELIVPVRTLTSILEELDISEIHFIKIDVEGNEAAVLKGLDLQIVRPWILLIEATQPNTQILDHHWESLILERGYSFTYFDGINRFYVADEHAELSGAFKVPPNWWDNFESRSEFFMRQQYTDLSLEHENLKQKYEDLKLEHKSLKAKYSFLESPKSIVYFVESKFNFLMKMLTSIFNKNKY